MSEWLLPLFPLQVVLFPRQEIPLHIFEERYKQMIGDCLEAKGEFGIVLANEGSIENTGCAAAVARVTKRYEDGRMDIVVRGSRRFEILLLNSEMPYLRGEPQFFTDDGAPPASSDPRRAKAMELYGSLKKMLPVEPDAPAEVAIEPDDAELSYQIISRLPVDLEFKQSLLPLRSEEERLKRVIVYLETLVARLEAALKARAGASGNGRRH
jgi:ATP-dependent Lon protease